MVENAYELLADALNALPNGYPRTASGIEIKILKKIFTPEQAEIACRLSGEMESAKTIADRVGQPAPAVTRQLMQMVREGMLWMERQPGKTTFRLAPFVVGIYEAQGGKIDHELAHLVEAYFMQGGAAGIMGLQPALHRVVPAQHTVKSEWILPYEDVRAILLNAKTFHAEDCICRTQQELLGEGCNFPKHACMSFSNMERPPAPGDLTREEALAMLDYSEEIGLVHTVSNVMQGYNYICNCCGCCCGILRGITDFGLDHSVAYANYYAVIDAGLCSNCGACRERCQVKAIEEGDGFSVVLRQRCIGCGLCVTGCPNQAVELVRKPEAEIVQPPVNFSAWEHERLHNRGLE